MMKITPGYSVSVLRQFALAGALSQGSLHPLKSWVGVSGGGQSWELNLNVENEREGWGNSSLHPISRLVGVASF